MRQDETDPMVGSGRRLTNEIVLMIITKRDALELVVEIRES